MGHCFVVCVFLFVCGVFLFVFLYDNLIFISVSLRNYRTLKMISKKHILIALLLL